MKKSPILFAIILHIVGLSVAASEESPLDEPAFKEATIGSEIKRGYDAVYNSAHDRLGPNLTQMANQMREVSGATRASPGYVLGGRMGELFVLDFLLRSPTVSANNSAEEITDASRLGHVIRREIRRRAEILSLTDDQLFAAIGKDFRGLFNRYDTGAEVSTATTESTNPSGRSQNRTDQTPLPEFAPLAQTEFIKLTKQFTLVNSKGREVKTLPPGKRLRVVARGADTITVDHWGERFVIPAAVTEPSQ